MIAELLNIAVILLQNAPPPTGTPVDFIYNLLQEGGLLMGALLVLYGQHRFYRYMIDKLEEKHRSQVEWLEGELERLSAAFLEKSREDTNTIRELTRRRD
jgi:hypothetical protein